MKKLTKLNRTPRSNRGKLALNRETLRSLHSEQLRDVAGGSIWPTCTDETTKVVLDPLDPVL